MDTKALTAQKHFDRADKTGISEVWPGCWLQTAADISIDAEQWDDHDPSKHLDFCGAPYWLTTDTGHISPVYDASDLITIL